MILFRAALSLVQKYRRENSCNSEQFFFFFQLVNSQEVIAAKEILIAVIKERDHKCQNFQLKT